MLCDEGWQRWALGLSPSLQAARRVSQELGLLAAFSWAGRALSTDLYQMLCAGSLLPLLPGVLHFGVLAALCRAGNFRQACMALSPREPPRESRGMESTSPSPSM